MTDHYDLWRDAFLLAFGASGLSSACPDYENSGGLSYRAQGYFNAGWAPVEAMHNELEWTDGNDYRPIHLGPEEEQE